MKNATTVIEISHSFIKVVIGSVKDGKVLIHFVNKYPIRQLLENGSIINKEGLLNAISKVNPIDNDYFNIHELIDNAVLILPSYGLEIYSTTQITSVISRERIVENQDIFNIYSIISNKKLPVDNDLIDIVPETYKIDSGEIYDVPPIGKTSRDITCRVNVHTLPKRINAEYSGIVSKAGITISHKVASTFASSILLASFKDIPNSSFMLDMGSNSTSVSLIGNGKLIASRSFAWGSNSITERIVECFNISEKEAERIKCLYGIDNRKMNFAYPITQSGNGKEWFREDLNKIITESLDNFINFLQLNVEQLAKNYNVAIYKNLPYIILGGGNKLHGLEDYLKTKLEKDNIILFTPEIIGARDSSLCACLGAILFHDKHPGVVEDINTVATPVSREE